MLTIFQVIFHQAYQVLKDQTSGRLQKKSQNLEKYLKLIKLKSQPSS